MGVRYVKGFIMSNDSWEIKTVDKKERIIEGFASTNVVDRVKDIVEPKAFEKTMNTFMKIATLLFNHDLNQPIGTVIGYKITDKGLWIRAKIGQGFEPADTVWKMIEQGIVKTFSIGFSIPEGGEEWTKDGIRVIKELDLHEISVVTVPANHEAIFEVSTDGKILNVKYGHNKEEKAVEPFKNLPIIDKPWDKRVAIEQCRKWASSDGSGDPDKINFDKYKKCFMWYDKDRKEELTAYKLPFVYIVDGKPHACKRAIMTIAAVLQGARGGVNIPEADKEKVKKVVESYYKKWNDVPPWKREKSITSDNVNEDNNIYRQKQAEEEDMEQKMSVLNAEEISALCEDIINDKFDELGKKFISEVESKLNEIIDQKIAEAIETKTIKEEEVEEEKILEETIVELKSIIKSLKEDK